MSVPHEDRLERAESMDLRAYISVLQARKWTVILVACTVFAGFLAFTLTRTPLYQAQTKVLVQSLPQGESGVVVPVIPETEIELVESDEIAGEVANRNDLTMSIDSVRSGLDVTSALSNQSFSPSQILEFDYVSDDPELAARLANSFAATYVDYRADRASQDLADTERVVQERVDQLGEDLSDLESRIQRARNAGNETIATTLELQRNLLVTRLSQQQQRGDDLKSQRAAIRDAARVIAEAEIPDAPFSPNYTANSLLGGLLALSLGVGFAFLRERLDDRFRARGDIEAAIGATVVGMVPRFKRPKGKMMSVVLADPTSLAAEAYRSLRTNLVFAAMQRSIKSFLITSPGKADGKTETSCNLAVALAHGGHRVILVSADLRRPTVEKYFEIESQAGLVDWLLGETTELSTVLADPGIAKLRILPAGHYAAHPSELIASPRFSSLISLLEDLCDVVIVDSPPLLAVADAAIISLQVGGTLLVINGSATHRSAAIHASEAIDSAGGTLIGVVVNSLSTDTDAYRFGYHSVYLPDGDPQLQTNGRLGRRRPSLRR